MVYFLAKEICRTVIYYAPRITKECLTLFLLLTAPGKQHYKLAWLEQSSAKVIRPDSAALAPAGAETSHRSNKTKT